MMTMLRRPSPLAGAFALAAICGCSAAGSSSRGPIVCPELAEFGPPLVYPAPNATGVPTAAGFIVFGNYSPGSNIDTLLVPSTGATLTLGTFGAPPSPIPAPTATPGAVAITSYFGVAHPQLASATTYTIQYHDTSGGSCPLPVSSSGSFTTQ